MDDKNKKVDERDEDGDINETVNTDNSINRKSEESVGDKESSFEEVEDSKNMGEKDDKEDLEREEEKLVGDSGKHDSLLGIDSVKLDKEQAPLIPDDSSGKTDKNIKKIQEGQIKWAVFLMVSIILIIIVIPFVNINYFNKFEYHGLIFHKTQLGQVKFYSTKFPVVLGTGQVIGEYAVNLRNDPREIEDIEVRTTYNLIKFKSYVNEDGNINYLPVFVSLDPFMEICEDSGIAMLTLSGFLKDSGLEVGSASMDKEFAAANDILYKRCEDESTVILVTQGNVNKITEIGDTCFEIRFKDCDILKVTEKFVLNILEQYGDRFNVE